MKIAVFAHRSMKHEVVTGAIVRPLGELKDCKLEAHEVIVLIGSPLLDEETELSLEQWHALWHYVKLGGKLYAEMITAFDFPSSRLLGWKQDFRKSRRTLEKLRIGASVPAALLQGKVSDGQGGLRQGSVLEWQGALAHGFAIESEQWLEFGAFKETHTVARDTAADDSAIKAYPALSVRKLGEGLVVHVNFTLFGSEDLSALRPYARWAGVIEALAQHTGIPLVIWPQAMQISKGESPEQAVRQSAAWFVRSGLLPQRDGKQGVYENIHSVTGSVSYDYRPDCHAHTALMFYLYGQLSGEQAWTEASEGLLQSLFDGGYQDLDPSSPSYGFFKWYQFPEESPDQIFTDDNAWVCLVLLYLFRKTGNKEYRKRGLLAAEALLATQHASGLRDKMLTRSQLVEMGPAQVAAELQPSMNPHFESIAHTAFIQAYLVTGEVAYLNTAIRGSIYMLEHLDELEFMYSRTSGYGRFVLPLAYLSKHDETGAIRAGLDQIIAYLLTKQHASGGIEEADNPDPERFGQEDAGVYIHNGEGIADQLYTNNFLLMNVWEAWKATDEPRYEQLYKELSAYLCHIQISSPDPRFDGGWMRAYDLNLGEYFGNNGDTGWGPYCLEGGWTNAMIPVGMLLGILNESIFD
ncbi:hypothetical protein D3C73_496340 [compost metagenome]